MSLLVSECTPSVFCFQETFLGPDDNISLRGLNVFSCVHAGCLGPSGGASVFVKSWIGLQQTCGQQLFLSL